MRCFLRIVESDLVIRSEAAYFFGYNHGQKSWNKFTFVALFLKLHLFSPSPHTPPPYNVGHVYTLFLQNFNIVLGEGGGATHFETNNSAFLKPAFKNTEH